jgi:hypothetical protein
MTEDIKLDGHHRVTLTKVFEHPIGHNIQWHDVLSLAKAVGSAEELKDGRYAITIGEETHNFVTRRDLDEQQVIDVRHMLRDAGVIPQD